MLLTPKQINRVKRAKVLYNNHSANFFFNFSAFFLRHTILTLSFLSLIQPLSAPSSNSLILFFLHFHSFLLNNNPHRKIQDSTGKQQKEQNYFGKHQKVRTFAAFSMQRENIFLCKRRNDYEKTIRIDTRFACNDSLTTSRACR